VLGNSLVAEENMTTPLGGRSVRIDRHICSGALKECPIAANGERGEAPAMAG